MASEAAHKPIQARASDSDESARYQAHLDRVSRSFAFCIRELSLPLRSRVGLAYLLCRLLDTVEDSAWPTLHAQMRAFESFDSFLTKRPSVSSVREWARSFPTDLHESEALLLADADSLFFDYHALPFEDREALREPIASMSRGMQSFAAFATSTNPEGERSSARCGLRVRSLAEANRYCFFVAGVVGEALTRLARLHVKGFSENGSSLVRAFHFGLFLQKTNLLKDQLNDEPLGRFLVPSRSEMRQSLYKDGQEGLEYLLELPGGESGFRLFCAWSLFLAIASAPFIEQAYQEKSAAKITREQTQALLEIVRSAEAGEGTSGGVRLRALFAEAMALEVFGPKPDSPALARLPKISVPRQSIASFRTLYSGALSDEALDALGLELS